MNTAHPNRRKTIVVNKRMQSRVIMQVSLVPCVTLTILMVLVAFFSHSVTEQALAAGVQIRNIVPLFVTVAAIVGVTGVFIGLSALKTSHRIAGPAYRICESMKRIRKGDIEFRVQLRKKDYLTNVRDELNLLIDWLNEHKPEGIEEMQDEDEVAAAVEEQVNAAEAAASVDEVAAPAVEETAVESKDAKATETAK